MTSDPFTLILALVVVALVPFLAIVATSFIKLSVVLLLVRNALGVQQIPPNMALNALAIILSGYIMLPVFLQTFEILEKGNYSIATVEDMKTTFVAAKGPLEKFLAKHADSKEKAFFLEASRQLWPAEVADSMSADSIAILLPAYTVSQLREAFEIGFLLYLPFLAIDLVVSNILLAMGMMMVSPLTISLPFKLFLFVAVDGWSRLILGLIKTYV
ncbi:type III secretion system export apparatus subunit SctR [Pseudovibrio sp. JE062]|uniref:type III secretion system export apparatus subunit SctR n=1 Tax=Pseudovibrio sp. JE062 TaxID=439495 RepID=UPI000186C279|nr:type III secretion system export apparatus subunit SctR [Pseudovibrio sp. JE062]EEA96180.1 type III secretion apparatus protein, YscR/HrcR family [Pseudovibrio sp. JE062]